jgi:hypothetical protein
MRKKGNLKGGFVPKGKNHGPRIEGRSEMNKRELIGALRNH